MHTKFIDLLRCPECKNSGLVRRQDRFHCNACDSEYPDSHGIPVLIIENERRPNYSKMLVLKSNWTHEAKWDKQFCNLIPDGKGVFLDYACGGGNRKWVESKGYDYIGLDYSLDHGVDFLANGLNIPLENNSVTICTSSFVMEHIPDPWKACNEIFRVLEPGGLYIGSTAFLYPFHSQSYYSMTHLGVKHMLEKSGFIVERLTSWKASGLEAIACYLVRGRILKYLVSFISRLLFNLCMIFRKAGGMVVKAIYYKDPEKIKRIREFMDEEKMRFASGFTYAARKPEKQ